MMFSLQFCEAQCDIVRYLAEVDASKDHAKNDMSPFQFVLELSKASGNHC